jgi:hypothetical protein
MMMKKVSDEMMMMMEILFTTTKTKFHLCSQCMFDSYMIILYVLHLYGINLYDADGTKMIRER